MTSRVEAEHTATGPQRSTFVAQHPVVTATLVAAVGVLALLLSWFAVAAHLTAVEPNAVFVDCGPALIGRPGPLPDPSCADAYQSVILGGLLFGLAGVASLAVAVWILVRYSGRSLPSD